MQEGFKGYVVKKFGAEKYSPEELDLNPIITSLWLKTKENVQSQLLKAQAKNDIYNEISWQHKADEFIEGCQKEGHTGKFFTERQIKVLLGESLLNVEELFQTIIREDQREHQVNWFCAIQ